MFTPGDLVIVKETGKKEMVLYGKTFMAPHLHAGADWTITNNLHQHSRRGVMTDDIKLAPRINHAEEPYSVDEYLPYIYGLKPLPNFEPFENLGAGISTLALGGAGPQETYVGTAFWNGEKEWARYFFNSGQFKGLDGTGYVVLYNMGRGAIGRFAICKHTPIADAGANPSRGWHPAHCTTCGLDLTVDSGD